MNGHGFADDAASNTLHGVGFHISDDIDAFNNHMGIITRDTTCPRLPLSRRNDDDFVTFNNLVHVENLKELQGQGHDLHELFAAQLRACHGAKNAPANGFKLGVEQHGGVAIKLDRERRQDGDTLAVRTTTAL